MFRVMVVRIPQTSVMFLLQYFHRLSQAGIQKHKPQESWIGLLIIPKHCRPQVHRQWRQLVRWGSPWIGPCRLRLGRHKPERDVENYGNDRLIQINSVEIKINNVPLKISQQTILYLSQDGLTGLCRNSIAFCRAGNIVFFPFLGIPDLGQRTTKKNTLMLGMRERGIIKIWFSKNNLQKLPFYSNMPALMSIPDTQKRNKIIALLHTIHIIGSHPLCKSYAILSIISIGIPIMKSCLSRLFIIQISTYGWDKCEQSPHFPRWKDKRGRGRRGCHTVLLSWKSERKKGFPQHCNIAMQCSSPFLQANGHWTLDKASQLNVM